MPMHMTYTDTQVPKVLKYKAKCGSYWAQGLVVSAAPLGGRARRVGNQTNHKSLPVPQGAHQAVPTMVTAWDAKGSPPLNMQGRKQLEQALGRLSQQF